MWSDALGLGFDGGPFGKGEEPQKEEGRVIESMLLRRHFIQETFDL